MISSQSYKCPRKYMPAFSSLLQSYLNSGKLRLLNSPFASLAFIIPKKGPNVRPRWVNNYHQLNSNTVTNSHPLLHIDNVLADCAKGKVWATIDMTDRFFQIKMHPDDIPLMAVSTPFGLYKWTVMPRAYRMPLHFTNFMLQQLSVSI